MSFEPTQFEPSGFPYDSTDFAMTTSSTVSVLPATMPTMDWEDDEDEKVEEESTPVEVDPDLEDDLTTSNQDELEEDVEDDDDDEFEQYMLGDDDD